MKPAAATLGFLAFTVAAAGQPASVVNSPHNLSAGGPGRVRATMEDEVCIFCHTPHNASPVRPLWNRTMPTEGYSIYTSRSLEARPGQPTGMSKMCLSCHDGTIALGSVVSRDMPIQMAGGITTIPAGASNIGTDLSDDHPISFRYDTSLVGRNSKLKSPAALPREVHLDSNAELQCTSCHDAHNDSLGKFLVIRNDNSRLCLACHQMGTTNVQGHEDCNACHQPHSAPSGPYLLRKATITDTCLSCHNGLTPKAANIVQELTRVSSHDTRSPVDPPEPHQSHATCTDCHEPHTMIHGPSSGLAMSPLLGKVAGSNASGAPTKSAASEYEVCFKCHAEGNEVRPTVSRRLAQANTRLQFSPSAVSYHPVEAPGRNSVVPSLMPGWTTASTMTCSSCHSNETSASGLATESHAVHGSNFQPLLSARYETADFTSESANAYALCYRCHDRSNILDDRSFPLHRKHIVDLRAPCAACHDAHGIASSQGNPSGNSNLINFATNIAFADPVSGRLEFRDTGMFSGECFLSCHGVAHSPMRYPARGPMMAPAVRGGRGGKK